MYLLRSLRATCAGALLAAVAGLPVEAVTLSHLVDTSAPAAFFIADAPTLREHCSHSPFTRTWQDPDIQRFFAPLREKMQLEQWDEKVKTATGHSLDEIVSVAQGEVLFAIPDAGWIGDDDNKEPHLLLAAVVKGQEDLVKSLLDIPVRDKDVEASEIEIAGQKVHMLKSIPKEVESAPKDEAAEAEADAVAGGPAADDDDGDEAKPAKTPTEYKFYWTIANGDLLVTSDTGSMERALRVLGGEDLPSLAQDEDFAETLKRTTGSDIYAHIALRWINPLATKKAEESSADAKPNPMGITPSGVVAALGLDNLHSAYFGWTIGNTEATARSGLRYTPGAKGIVQLITITPQHIDLPSFVPPQWISAAVANASIPQFYKQLMALVDQVSPMASGMAQGQIRTLSRNMGVDLEQDLIGSLGDQIVAGVALRPGVTAPKADDLFNFVAISVRNADGLTRSIEALRGMAGPSADKMFPERDYLGTKIAEFTPPEGSQGAKAMALAITPQWLFLSIGSSAPVEAAIQGLQDGHTSMWDQDDVKKSLADIPSDAVAISYENTKRGFGALLSVYAQLLSQVAVSKGEDPLVDTDAVPSDDTVAKYWDYGVAYTTLEADGLHSHGTLHYPAP